MFVIPLSFNDVDSACIYPSLIHGYQTNAPLFHITIYNTKQSHLPTPIKVVCLKTVCNETQFPKPNYNTYEWLLYMFYRSQLTCRMWDVQLIIQVNKMSDGILLEYIQFCHHSWQVSPSLNVTTVDGPEPFSLHSSSPWST